MKSLEIIRKRDRFKIFFASGGAAPAAEAEIGFSPYRMILLHFFGSGVPDAVSRGSVPQRYHLFPALHLSEPNLTRWGLGKSDKSGNESIRKLTIDD